MQLPLKQRRLRIMALIITPFLLDIAALISHTFSVEGIQLDITDTSGVKFLTLNLSIGLRRMVA